MKHATSNLMRMLVVAGVVAVSAGMSVYAQQAFRVGVIGAANFNYVNAGTEKFLQVPGNPGFASNDFSGANDFELYSGVMGEYLFNNQIGVMLNVAYDARCVEKKTNDNTFSPHIKYISFEPGIRVNLGMPELYASAGGTVAVKAWSKYDYTPSGVDGARTVTDQDLANVRDVAFGAWANVGYDFRVNNVHDNIGYFVTPFVGASYLFDQMKSEANTVDDTMWNTLSVRGGVQVKMQF